MNFKQVGLLISVAFLIMIAIAVSNSTAETSEGVETQIMVFLDSLYPATQSSWTAWFDNLTEPNHSDISTSLSKEETIPTPQEPVEEPIEKPANNSSERIKDLQDYISDLEGVDTGTKSSLVANLNNAITMADKEDREKTTQRLEKIIESIEAQHLPKDELSSEQAEYIVAELGSIIELVETPSVNTPPNNNENTTVQVTTDGIVYLSDIYRDRIVWVGSDSSGFSGIHLYNISTGERLPLVEMNPTSSPDLDIYEDIIVWQDMRNGNWDIYRYEISTGKEQRITSHTANQTSPEIYGDTIVWADDRNGSGEIFMYDISTGMEEQITTSGKARNPAIYGDTIAWADENKICMYDILTKEIKQVSDEHSMAFSAPSIYGKKIVWSDSRNSSHVGATTSDIYLYDITSGGESRITSTEYTKHRPAIYGDIIAWADEYMFSNIQIYACNLSTGETFYLASDVSMPFSTPAIYDNKIVWLEKSKVCLHTLTNQDVLTSYAPVNEQSEHNSDLLAVESTTNETVADTNEESIVENKTVEVVANLTNESISIVENNTKESEIKNSDVKNISNSTEESIDTSIAEEDKNKTRESSEGSIEDTVVDDAAKEPTEELGDEEKENISDNTTEEVTEESSENSDGANVEDTYEEQTEESTEKSGEETEDRADETTDKTIEDTTSEALESMKEGFVG